MAKIMKEKVEDIELTKAYSQQLIALAKENSKIVDVEADVGNCIYGPDFKKEFPDRYIDLGICEQSLSSVSAGMALAGCSMPMCSALPKFATRS